MTAATTTFTMRMTRTEYELLSDIAALESRTIASLAREIMAEGIQARTDPVEIDRRVEKMRTDMQEAARKLRERKPE